MIPLIFICTFLSLLAQSCANEHIVMSHIYFRHGDRAPLSVYPKDEYPEHQWTRGIGYLTDKGIENAARLGQFLKSRYVDELKLITSTYNQSDVYVRSSDRDRCIMTAQIVLTNLFPALPSERDLGLCYQPIPIHTIPESVDHVLRSNRMTCKGIAVLIEEIMKSDVFQEDLTFINEYVDVIRKYSGYEYHPLTVHELWDNLLIKMGEEIQIPEWCTPQLFGILEKAVMVVFKHFYNASCPIQRNLRAGSMLQEIVNRTKSVLENRPDPDLKKMYIYSAHDTTLTSLFVGLGITVDHIPEFTSSVSVELWKYQKEDQSFEHKIKIIYRNGSRLIQEIPLPECPKCSASEFIKIYSKHVTVDRKLECEITSSIQRFMLKPAVQFVMKFLNTVLVMFAVIAIFVFCTSKKKPSAVPKMRSSGSSPSTRRKLN